MTAIKRAQVTKELNKASAALHAAFCRASANGDRDLAASIRRHQKAIADEIIKLNGGPVKLTGADLLSH